MDNTNAYNPLLQRPVQGVWQHDVPSPSIASPRLSPRAAPMYRDPQRLGCAKTIRAHKLGTIFGIV